MALSWGYISVAPCGRRTKRIGACATRATGMRVNIATTQGVLEVFVWSDNLTGNDIYNISMAKHGGKGANVIGEFVGDIACGVMGQHKGVKRRLNVKTR